MKKAFLFILTIGSLLQCHSSNDKELEKAWTVVKEKSLQKAEQGIRSTRSLIKNKEVPKDLLSRALASSHRPRVSSRSEHKLDSLNFYYLRISSDSMDVFMPRFFHWLLTSQDSLVRPMFAGFQEDYLKAAKSLDSAKTLFNEIAKKGGSHYSF